MRPYKVSTNFNKSLVKGRSGQATVELVLLLVVVVAMVALFSTKIYKPFGNFTKSYMGEYLACLLDYGVLPKLGSEDDVCSESFKNIEGVAGNNSSNNTNASGVNNQNNKREVGALDKDRAELRAARAGNGVSAGGINFPGGRRSQGSQATDAVAVDEKKTEIETNSGKSKFSSSGVYGSNFGGQGKIIKTTDDSFLSPNDKEKIKKEKSKTNKIGTVESEESLGKQKKLLLKPPERKITNEEEDKPWTFGKFIRYLVIIAILIAIVLFILGQAVQISKSWEK